MKYADAMKVLDGQLSLLSTKLKPKIIMGDEYRGLVMVTRSGKEAIGNVTRNEKVHTHEEGKGIEKEEITIHQDIPKELQSDVEKHKPSPKVKHPLPKISPPFPQCLKKKNEISIAPEDQEKTTFTGTYGTFAFKQMLFGLCNAPATFQHCMLSIFDNMVEDSMEVFMDDFSIVGDTSEACLEHLGQVLQRCVETNLVLN
ncbi:uncharacterized protein LOC125869924 [Solanum stenotomum]|uniref:uncharacterized protein LOC125869924 n=1 Tax=Solanum stenotomum TaxID=172797 RepID=UPI0020D10D0A|nr:uncharacterized protein LOC125869924 [Solanum stenotomum]